MPCAFDLVHAATTRNKHYVNVPLEATYQRAWEGTPAFWREVVLGKPIG